MNVALLCKKQARLLVNTLKRLFSAFSGETEGVSALLTLGSILFWLMIPVLAVAQTKPPPVLIGVMWPDASWRM